MFVKAHQEMELALLRMYQSVILLNKLRQFRCITVRSAQVRMGSATDLVRAASGCAVSVCIQIFDTILRIHTVS